MLVMVPAVGLILLFASFGLFFPGDGILGFLLFVRFFVKLGC